MSWQEERTSPVHLHAGATHHSTDQEASQSGPAQGGGGCQGCFTHHRPPYKLRGSGPRVCLIQACGHQRYFMVLFCDLFFFLKTALKWTGEWEAPTLWSGPSDFNMSPGCSLNDYIYSRVQQLLFLLFPKNYPSIPHPWLDCSIPQYIKEWCPLTAHSRAIPWQVSFTSPMQETPT